MRNARRFLSPTCWSRSFLACCPTVFIILRQLLCICYPYTIVAAWHTACGRAAQVGELALEMTSSQPSVCQHFVTSSLSSLRKVWPRKLAAWLGASPVSFTWLGVLPTLPRSSTTFVSSVFFNVENVEWGGAGSEDEVYLNGNSLWDNFTLLNITFSTHLCTWKQM